MSEALVFLIGPRGSGKSTVAQLLAHALHWDWLDADAELEKRYGQSIRAIFAGEGEIGFRNKESAILADLCGLRRHVIATGGGVVLRESNRQLMRSSGRVVWLTGDAETLWKRVRADDSTVERRPPLTDSGGLEEMAQIMSFREPLYRQCADLRLDTREGTPADIATAILHWLHSSGQPEDR